jgi:hypothetical protein
MRESSGVVGVVAGAVLRLIVLCWSLGGAVLRGRPFVRSMVYRLWLWTSIAIVAAEWSGSLHSRGPW